MDMVEIRNEDIELQAVIIKLKSGNIPDLERFNSLRKSGVLTIALSEDSNDEKYDAFDTSLRVYGASLEETSILLKKIICEKGIINQDLRDFSNVLKDGGAGTVFVSRGTGQGRMSKTLSRIRDTNTEPGIYSARNILLDISYSKSNRLVMSEMLAVKEFMDLFINDSQTNLQLRIDDSLRQQVGVFLIVTGLIKHNKETYEN